MSDDPPYTTKSYENPRNMISGGKIEKTMDHEHIKEHNTMAQMKGRGHEGSISSRMSHIRIIRG
jgi:hypothetical protein